MKAFSFFKKKISTFQIIIAGFAGLAFLGALLLMLPVSSADGSVTPFANALFTAVSAVCVTGLSVYDTASHWSYFGQAVLLILIQTGGMGVMTVAVFFVRIMGKKVSLKQRSTLQDALSVPHVGGIVKLAGFIVRCTIVIELLGAALLAPVFCRDFGAKGIWMAIFHSVSAFCNAGFDLMGNREAFSSMTTYAAQPLVTITLMCLIVTGGIGFLTWDDVRTHKWRLKKYRTQSKVILVTSAVLIAVPAVLFFLFEYASLPTGERLLAALFQSITSRTAGFNTMDLNSLSEAGQAIFIIWMLIGGAPGSTAGGMKITTLAVLCATALASFRRDEEVHFFGRRIDDETVKNAVTILLMYLALFLGGGILLCMLEGEPMLTCLFETASAVGTVGVTLGITPGLRLASKILIMVLMFFGRVGGLTLMYAALKQDRNVSKLPRDHITVG